MNRGQLLDSVSKPTASQKSPNKWVLKSPIHTEATYSLYSSWGPCLFTLHRNKSQARDRYLVVTLETPFYNIKKLITKAYLYVVNVTECFKVSTEEQDTVMPPQPSQTEEEQDLKILPHGLLLTSQYRSHHPPMKMFPIILQKSLRDLKTLYKKSSTPKGNDCANKQYQDFSAAPDVRQLQSSDLYRSTCSRSPQTIYGDYITDLKWSIHTSR